VVEQRCEVRRLQFGYEAPVPLLRYSLADPDPRAVREAFDSLKFLADPSVVSRGLRANPNLRVSECRAQRIPLLEPLASARSIAHGRPPTAEAEGVDICTLGRHPRGNVRPHGLRRP
jgi:hypothetical protein